MKMCSIASGSSGNCSYISNKSTGVLIDAGISGKKIEQGLDSIGVNPKDIKGLLITHEHSDHVKGVGVLARKYEIPIYGTAETINSMLKSSSIGRIPEGLFRYVKPDESFMIEELEVRPFSISHDAANPVCYTFHSDNKKIGYATDLGKYDDYIVENLRDSDLLFLEANHDVNMLMVGSYPYYLKQRILGDHGHLSNDLSANLICELLHDKLKHVILAHLSKENNFEALAYETVAQCVSENVSGYKAPKIVVANREVPSEVFSLA